MLTHLRRVLPPALTASLAVFAATGCGDLGTHSLVVEGNDAVTQGIDAAASDGWTISFTSFVVVIHEPGLIEQFNDKPTWVREAGVTVWDVATSVDEGDELGRSIRATTYDGVDFRLAPPSANGYEALAGNVSSEVVSAAVDEDWSVHVVGSAEMGGNTLSFDWTFDTNVFFRCELDADSSVVLGAEGDETTVLEILGDALFTDGAGGVVFQPFADADDGDGVLTADEVAAAGLLDGLQAATRELGGVRGFGPCPEYSAPDEGE